MPVTPVPPSGTGGGPLAPSTGAWGVRMGTSALDAVMDGLDIETYLVCGSEREGKDLALRLGHELNLGEVDIMYQEFDGYGMRVRLRKYIHRPGEPYRWLG